MTKEERAAIIAELVKNGALDTEEYRMIVAINIKEEQEEQKTKTEVVGSAPVKNTMDLSIVYSSGTKNEWILVIPESDALFFMDQFNDPFVKVRVEDHFEVLRVQSKAFRRIVTGWLLDREVTPTSGKVSDLMGVCEAQSVKTGLTYPLYNRYFKGDAIYVDLGDSKWRVAKINREGWQILDDAPYPIFRRYSHFKEIKVIGGGIKQDFDDFLNLLNLKTREDRVLHSCLLTSALIPGFPHIIEAPFGPQGSGKTSLMKYTRMLIDNSEILVLSIPTRLEQLNQVLMHHYAPPFDNVDILYDWQSDAICRGVTGEGVQKRELYTIDDDVVYKYMRVIGVNGINPSGTKADFVDRSLIIELVRINKSDRLTEEQIERKAEELAPKVVGYLYDVVVKALNFYDQVKTELQGKLPRMADATIYGEACARALGYGVLEFYNAYMEKLGAQAKDVVAESVVGSILLRILEKDSDYQTRGLTKMEPLACYELMFAAAKEANIDTREGSFPKKPNALTRKLNQIKPNLLEFGIEFSTGKSGQRSYTFRDTGKTPSNLSESPILDSKEAGQYTDDVDRKEANTAKPIVLSDTDDRDDKDDMGGILSNMLGFIERQGGKAHISAIALDANKTEADTRTELLKLKHDGWVSEQPEDLWLLV